MPPGLAAAERPPAARKRTPPGAGAVRDLRQRAGRTPGRLSFAAGDLVVVSGLPGSGKSTLMDRAVPGARIDSQDAREHVSRRVPHRLPYALYRPLVRLAHYARLRHTLRTGASVVVHDCGTQTWVRRWLAREARRRARTLHLLLLDVAPEAALAGQRERGRAVSRYAFWRHRRAVRRLTRELEAGDLPAGCASAVLLDRPAADSLRMITFGE
jgi:predicted kinase